MTDHIRRVPAPRGEAAPEPGAYRAPASEAESTVDEGRVLLRLPRGEGQEVRLALREYRGRPFVDVRAWWRAEDGRWLPSRKGCSLRLVELQRVAEVLGDGELQLLGGRRYAKPRGTP